MYVLAKFAERYDAASYGSLIRRALGRKSGAGLAAVTVVYLWGASVAYLVSEHWGCLSEAALSRRLQNLSTFLPLLQGLSLLLAFCINTCDLPVGDQVWLVW